MKTKDVYELSPYELKEKLSEIGIELTTDQYMNIRERNRTFLYAKRKSWKNKTSMLFRTTLPLYVIWFLIMVLIVQPIKWICTGDYYFDTKNPVYLFTISWSSKLGM